MGFENGAEANGVVLNVNIGITFRKFSVFREGATILDSSKRED